MAPVRSDAPATQDLAARHRQYNDDVLSRGDLTLLDDLVADDHVSHMVGSPDLRGPGALRAFVAGFRAAFPDAQFTVDERIVAGDTVVARWTVRGTHLGEFNGLPPTGRRVTTTGMAIHRFAAGKMVESWDQLDALGLLQQLGAIRAPTPPAGGSPEENTALVLRYFLTSHNAPYDHSVIDELLEPSYAAKHKDYMRREHIGFPDAHFTIEDVVASGDKVVLHWTFTGTHLGEYRIGQWTFPATGNRTHSKGFMMFQVENGKVTRGWLGEDFLAFFTQIGATATFPDQTGV